MVLALFCSVEEAKEVKLRIGLLGNDAAHTFTFKSPQPFASQEREKFKQELTPIIARNKQLNARPPTVAAPQPIATSSTATTTPLGNGVQAPAPIPSRLQPAASFQSHSRAASVASVSATDRRGTPVITGGDPAAEFRLRKKVLMNNPELGALHRDLVMTGQITEAEFWDGREVR